MFFMYTRAQVHRLMKNNELARKDLDTVIDNKLGQGQPSILKQVCRQMWMMQLVFSNIYYIRHIHNAPFFDANKGIKQAHTQTFNWAPNTATQSLETMSSMKTRMPKCVIKLCWKS